jgi:RND family efflux transporter MFP subunit
MMKGQIFTRYSLIAAAALAIVGWMGCSESKPPALAPAEKVHRVALLQVQKATVPDAVDATGTVRAALSAQLASQVMGTITRVSVHEGDHVRRGEVLVSIDEAQQQAAYTSAKAGLQASQESIAAADADYALAEATMKRYQTLYDKKSLSPQEYDEVKTKLAAAQARREAAHAGHTQAEAGVSQAGTAISFTKVRAPFDGVVTSKLAEPGAMAAPGVPLLVVEDPSRFRLETQVDESKIGAVKLGESVPVVIDELGDQPIEGKVTQIVPAADPASRTFTVKIDLPNPTLSSVVAPDNGGAPLPIRSGLFGRARFPRGQREAIEIPKSAVLSRGQLQAVYIVGSDHLASLRYVTLGAASGDQIEVLSGLQNGDRIVAQPGDGELSGKQVEAQ